MSINTRATDGRYRIAALALPDLQLRVFLVFLIVPILVRHTQCENGRNRTQINEVKPPDPAFMDGHEGRSYRLENDAVMWREPITRAGILRE